MDKVTMKVKKLYEDAKLPKKAHIQDGCYDVYCYLPKKEYPAGEVIVQPHETVKLHTGFAASVPEGYFGTIVPRSGLATKEGLRPANTPSVIDVGYTGEWLVAIHNDSEVIRIIQNGDRICQMTLIPIPQLEFELVDELEDTERGATGFGDSGKK